MFEFLNPLREVTFFTVFLKMFCAVICGGAIGIERERKRRTAGFRTHILICLGAAMTTMISHYLFSYLHLDNDVSRLGASVIAGIGFVGAGTIIVTKRRQIKGLTTAAGLWTCAIIGLSVGAGYYEAGILATVIILLAEIFFSRFEYWVLDSARNINIYVEYTGNDNLDAVILLLKSYRVVILDLEITKSGSNACAIFQLQLPKKLSHDKLLTVVSTSEGIISVEEL